MRRNAPTGAPPVARALTITGRVQGVSFRWSLRREAARHGVVGWVANLDDGSVQAHLEGEPDAVERAVTWVVAGGPPAAEIEEVEVTEAAVTGAEAFTIRR